jgi:multisubunit Na+/H+ antiporter MnhB subunit
VSPAFVAVLLTAVAVGLGAAVFGRLARRDGGSERPDRPWWGNPAVWIGASVGFLALGLFVAPRLLGFTFLLLPLVWMRLPGRRGDWGRGSRDEHER